VLPAIGWIPQGGGADRRASAGDVHAAAREVVVANQRGEQPCPPTGIRQHPVPDRIVVKGAAEHGRQLVDITLLCSGYVDC
jgi:hypothetical protein